MLSNPVTSSYQSTDLQWHQHVKHLCTYHGQQGSSWGFVLGVSQVLTASAGGRTIASLVVTIASAVFVGNKDAQQVMLATKQR